jgi:spermidine/putrescine transport system permease protein
MLLDDDALLASVGNSLMVAAAAMIIALLLGFPAALALDRASFPGKGIPPPGAAAADPARHHHRSLAADALRHRGLKLSLLTIMLGHGTALISVATTESSRACRSSTARRKKPRSISAPANGRPSGA